MTELFGLDNWEMENDYVVKVKSNLEMFQDGVVHIPDQLIDFFGCDEREKRVIFLYEGREYPSYLESESFDSNYSLTWSKALSSKFIGVFPNYEEFFETPESEWDDRKKEEQPYFVIEKLEEDEFAVKLIMPSDEALTVKQSLFDFLGPGKSLMNIKDSYELVFFQNYLKQSDNRWKADVFMVSAAVQKFYQARVKDGKDQDRNAEKIIEDVGTAGLDDILSFLMDGPYITFSEQGFISMDSIDDHFYFSMDQSLIDEVNADDKRLLIELLEEKINYYFERLDGPGLQENFTMLIDQYADYFTKDFRYSFKDILTDGIPGCIEGLSIMPPNRYKIVGFAGDEEWAEIPWIEIMDKRISRFPNTAVAIKYLLNKDSKKLYLTLCAGYKTIESNLRKNGVVSEEDTDVVVNGKVADQLKPIVEEIRTSVNPGSFESDEKNIDLKDPRFVSGIAFYREYYGVVPSDNVMETDLAEMLEIYDTYYHRCILKDTETVETEAEAEIAEAAEETVSQDEDEDKDNIEADEGDAEEISEEDLSELTESNDGSSDLEEKEAEEAASGEEIDESTEAEDAESEESIDVIAQTMSNVQEVSKANHSQTTESSVQSDTLSNEDAENDDADNNEDGDFMQSAIATIKTMQPEKSVQVNEPQLQSTTNIATTGYGGTAAIQYVNTGLSKDDIIAIQNAFITAQKEVLKSQEESKEDKGEEIHDRSELKTDEAMTEAPTDIVGALRKISAYISANGYSCDLNDVNNLFLCLKSSPMVILTGASGVGKTTFIRLFAEAIGANNENGRFQSIPVRPGWDNADQLLGHLDTNGRFVPGSITEITAKAVENPDKPYFLCLDEMGLQKIEKYFSEVLSVIGTRRVQNGHYVTDRLLGSELFGNDEAAKDYYGDLTFPENLFIIGTISTEEIDNSLSAKLIDQAAVIEVRQPSLQLTPAPNSKPEAISYVYDFLKREPLDFSTITNHKKMIMEVVTLLDAVNGILAKGNVQIGFRVRDEICYYLYYNADYGLMTQEKALDYELSQKLLPRIYGTSIEADTVLIDLFKICAGIQDDKAIKNYDGNGGLFPRCASKLSRMDHKFERTGIVTFWKS